MTDIDFLLKMIRVLPRTKRTDLYLLMQDDLRRGIPYPQPGEPFNPARCPLATPAQRAPANATR